MSKTLSQKDYLKKYLSSDDKLKKRKKKSKESSVKTIKATVKIIDDDDHGEHLHNEVDEEMFATNEEAPQIVGIFDERAPDVIMKQEYQQSGKWKKIGDLESNKTGKNQKQIHGRRSSEASPPRKDNLMSHKTKVSPDQSPPRKRKNSSDASPPRRREFFGRRDSSDVSPPRKSRKSVDSMDNSPPRRANRQIQRDRSHSSSPKGKSKSHERLRKRKDSSDVSPPRRLKNSPASRRHISPKSRRSSSRSRQKRSRWSPIKREPASPPRSKRNHESPPRSSKMTKTLDGKASGLQDARTLKRENDEFKQRQEKMFRELRPEMSGKDADVVIRDRRGRNKDFEKDVETERKKTEFEEARKKEYDRWGKGLKQIEDLEKRYQEHVHEANKPLARMADDEDLQNHLRNQERLDDPMLEYFRKKKQDENKKKGVEEKPKYQGQFPDNRFNIRPGYRWDGVDRSNGYEKKYFGMVNSKKSLEEEAYRYSTEDM